jgi:murein DD-endopeptidase MepM/ murein hydrolase activator NlpD
MSFVILSTGTLTGSTMRTFKTRTVVYVAAIAVLAILACGLAAGYRVAQTGGFAGASGPVAALKALQHNPDGPESRALIERVGALSGRLIRLETQAVILARQVGVAQGGGAGGGTPAAAPMAARADAAGPPANGDQPSGGPFVALGAFPSADLPRWRSADFAGRLVQLAVDLDRLEATLARVAQAAAVRNLDTMAYPSRRPVAGGVITSGFGTRLDPFTRRPARHTGLDFRAPFGAPILASAGGRVRFAGRHGAYGRTVEIDHGDGLVTRYGHASKLFVHAGDIVLPGQRIAAVGSTGRSTGPHVHFEVLRNGVPVEPRLYLARNGS